MTEPTATALTECSYCGGRGYTTKTVLGQPGIAVECSGCDGTGLVTTSAAGCLHNEPPCGCGGRDCPECGLPRPDATFDNIPDGWRVLWCPECGYSVTFTGAAYITYSESEWNTLLWQEAVAHAHA